MTGQDEDDAINFNEYFESSLERHASYPSVGADFADEGVQRQKRKWRQGNEGSQGERVAFSDNEDSDEVYVAFKKRKGGKKGKPASATPKAKAKVSSNKIVGKRPRAVAPKEAEKGKKRERHYGDDADEEALMETTLPDHLRQRRSAWENRYEELGDVGLRVPPGYDDVDFSGDERMETLSERPQFLNQKPRAPYRDIELPYSAGVIPAPIAQWLRDYQVEGAAFLHKKFVYQDGGILGDDMGLGKTIQVIAFLTAAFGKTGDERDAKRMRKMRRKDDGSWYPRILIICPGSLMANWQKELETWGWWSVYLYHGSSAAKEEAMAAATSGRLEIMITTYASYRLNESHINTVRWDAVIADECHTIKERTSDISVCMNQINALCRIGLTGTAIQNKYEELWTLLNWTRPGKIGPISTWNQAIALPLKLGQSHDATVAQLSKARSTATKLVNNLLPQFMLRRMKSLIADQLPKKSDRVIFCPLASKQAEAYNNFCDSEIVRRMRDAHEECTCGSMKKQGWCCYSMVDGPTGPVKWQTTVFPTLKVLQQLANHLALMVPRESADKDKEEREVERLKLACPDDWEQLYQQRDNIANFANQDFCGKWRVLKKLLRLWYENGDKVLVFSHSVKLLQMLQMLFKSKTSYSVSYLDGSMKFEDRQIAVDDFNSNPSQFVFLISTRAGGVGLNITSANKVVVVDPNWNPAHDLQAQDRAYRIGQTRDVDVFRLVSAGTIEEIIYARQIYKQQQANIGYNASVERRYFKGVQDQQEMKGEIFGLRNLFQPQSESIVLRDIVNKTNIAESRAGLMVAGLELEDNSQDGESESSKNDPDGAISQLVQEIVDAPPSNSEKMEAGRENRKDPVQAILSKVGVEYTHENAEVIGTSKVETKISSHAIKAANDLEHGREIAFVKPLPRNSANPHGDLQQADEGEIELPGKHQVKYSYRPAEDIRKRQFCSIAKHFGYADVTEFALVVESWTQGQRRDCLEKFYIDRMMAIADDEL